MQSTDNSSGLPTFGADDSEWVAGLLDTMAEADMDATAATLEGLARRLRKASKAGHAPTRVSAASIRAAFELRAKQDGGSPCR